MRTTSLNRTGQLYTSLIFLLIASLALALFWGSWNTGTLPEGNIVLQLRLPRALLALSVGILLSLAGVQMQAVLRNPLADPYVLGTASSAGLATLAALLAGLPHWTLQPAGMAGALAATLLILRLNAHRPDPLRTLLSGVGLAAACSALITLLLSLSPQEKLNSLLFWLMGDLSARTPPAWLLPVVLAAITLSWSLAPRLDLLSLGRHKAQTLGLHADRTLLHILTLAAFLTGLAVSLSGPIGFLGLLVPHVIRLWHGSLHRHLVPASALLGGALLILADTLAQHLFSPYQLPVGAITALLGAPWLVWMLWHGREVGR